MIQLQILKRKFKIKNDNFDACNQHLISEDIRPFPKADPRKKKVHPRKRSTAILTDTRLKNF